MSIPLSLIRHESSLPNIPLGRFVAECISATPHLQTLLDCLCSSTNPAIFSPDPTKSVLTHDRLKAFLGSFVLPYTSASQSLGPNDRVLVALPNGPECAVAILSVACYHTCAPINASCTSVELREDAKRLGVKLILSSQELVERLELGSIQQELGCDVVLVQPQSDGPAGLFQMSCLNRPTQIPKNTSQPHRLSDQSLVLQTSGTSGKKKVVPYSLQSLIVGSWAVVQSWELRESDVNLNMMPLFHVGGFVRCLCAPILSGGSAVMCSGFDPADFWSLAKQYGVTWYYAAPTLHQAILSSQPDSIDIPRDLRIRMVCNAAGGLLPSLAMDMKRTFKAVILPSYGMTECMPIASPPQSYDLDRPGCSGIPCGPEISIRDPLLLDRELQTGRVGAICVRGLPTFLGYEVSPDKSVPLDTSCFSNGGWFDTGDVGYIDGDGYLFITGRSKEIINKGGEVISPFEVEEAVVTAAKKHVKSTLAFSVEHDVLQEAIGVVIVSQPQSPRIGLRQLQDAVKNYLHPSKWPSVIVYMDDLPKNSTGKAVRINLAKRFGLPKFNDKMPVSQRQFEAMVPPTNVSLSDPISCAPVSFSIQILGLALERRPEVKDYDFGTSNGLTMLCLSVDPECPLDSKYYNSFLAQEVDGYLIPENIYVVRGPLERDAVGELNLDAIRKDSARLHSSAMSKTELKVRDLVAELLNLDAAQITSQSDFFLLGGNSLLIGKLGFHIRKETGTKIPISNFFNASTIAGIASLIESSNSRNPTLSAAYKGGSRVHSTATSITAVPTGYDYEQEYAFLEKSKARGQNHPLCLFVQALPVLFFYPLKAALTWALLLFILSYTAAFLDGGFWIQITTLLAAILASRLAVRVVCPVAAILFKWVVIGRYKPGVYRIWSTYYLRCWIVEQSLRSAGKGIFQIHPSLHILYYRLLGANIADNVVIDSKARLGEYDLITLRDGCRIDKSHVRPFCVEREGFFRLESITIGRCAVINSYTTIAPGAVIPDSTVYGPHSSSHELPSPKPYAAYNRTLSVPSPHWFLQAFIAWPIIMGVILVAHIPWIFCIWLMLEDVKIIATDLNAMEAVIQWFSNPQRVGFHLLSRIVRAIFTPVLQLLFGILVKRLMGLNKESSLENLGQLVLLRRYINSILLSQEAIRKALKILGTHYEVVSIVYRAMGAKIGKRIYWPGSGIYCPDPELLEVGDDVIFGSRSEIYTHDRLGFKKVTIGAGAMIADRVVLLPGASVGRHTVMGSGSLGKRDTTYEDFSTWMGCENGNAICLGKGNKESKQTTDTSTPFGRAFYQGKANYWVWPYTLIFITNIIVAGFSAAWWSISPIVAAQILRLFLVHLNNLDLFKPTWYRLGILYSLIAFCFIAVLTIQAVISILWVILAKWLVIGRRHEGSFEWDKSSYCQRWQLHLTLSRVLFRGYGNGGILGHLNGSAYIVWFYRALGATIGKNCAIFAGGFSGLMTEPDLVQMGDEVSLDDCSVVAHINSRGVFAMNKLKIGTGCALRSGSRLLSGASMEDNSMLCEHTLLVSGDIAESGCTYVGWPGCRRDMKDSEKLDKSSTLHGFSNNQLVCSHCRQCSQQMV